MNPSSQRLTQTLLFAALVFVLAGCQSVEYLAAPQQTMTVPEARRAMTDSLRGLQDYGRSIQDVRFTRQRVTFKAASPEDTQEPGKIVQIHLVFTETAKFSLRSPPGNVWILVQSNDEPLSFHGGPYAYFSTEDGARKFVNALLALRAAALAPDTEEADFVAFSNSANVWKMASPKPEMSTEALTFKVLAEDAFKRKDFAAALEAYCSALEKHPMWPAGHYNAALLAAEIEDYELAAKHMRRYLVLAPNAKDAASAKEKLLLWQYKAKQLPAS